MNRLIKSTAAITVVLFSFIALNAQTMTINNKQQRVVFQLSNGDTLVHKSFIKQLNNLLNAMPDVKIEIVAHGPGVEFLCNNSLLRNNIEKLHRKGIALLACQNTLNEKKIKPENLLPIVNVIPAGIAHIITRQSEGWSYIKVGF